jgi:predicted transcriptional regulator
MSAATFEQPAAKERARAVVDAQPDDASIDEIVRELSFDRMIERGLADAREGRLVEHDEALTRLRSWRG